MRHVVEQGGERPHAELPFEADPDVDGDAQHGEARSPSYRTGSNLARDLAGHGVDRADRRTARDRSSRSWRGPAPPRDAASPPVGGSGRRILHQIGLARIAGRGLLDRAWRLWIVASPTFERVDLPAQSLDRAGILAATLIAWPPTKSTPKLRPLVATSEGDGGEGH